MAEFIDREALRRQLSLLAERYTALGNVRVAQDYNWVVTVLDGAPVEDVAPVVRCRDCKFMVPEKILCAGQTYVVGYKCDLRDAFSLRTDDYCSRGVRRGGVFDGR